MDKSASKIIATIGGTFDILHHGHSAYIKQALKFSDYMIIYLSTNKYLERYRSKSYKPKPYSERYENLREFVNALVPQSCFEIRPHSKPDDFDDVYLNEFTDANVQYLAVVSPEYYHKFLQINDLREQKKMSSILLLVKPRHLEKLPDGNQTELSSGKIRKGVVSEWSTAE